MIFVTGDCHSEFQKFSTASFPEQKEMTKDDMMPFCKHMKEEQSKEIQDTLRPDCKNNTTLKMS